VLDELIKNVTEALEAKDMLQNTLIVYTAVRCSRVWIAIIVPSYQPFLTNPQLRVCLETAANK
jgi:hypothetical protein